MNTYGEYVIAFKSNDNHRPKNLAMPVKRLPREQAIEYYTRKLAVIWKLIQNKRIDNV